MRQEIGSHYRLILFAARLSVTCLPEAARRRPDHLARADTKPEGGRPMNI